MSQEELIELYFENNLNEEQKALFDSFMLNDAVFKEQVVLEEQTKKAIISIKKQALKVKLQKLESNESSKIPTRIFKIAIAASLLVALGLFGWMQFSQSDSNEQLYAQYYEPYANVIAPLNRGNESEDNEIKAFTYYETRRYEQASKEFEKLHQTTNTSYSLFYQAICELQLGNTDKAITLLNTHKAFTDKVSEQRNWYLALAYLKNQETKKTKKILQNIISKKAYKYKDALVILKKLD